MYSKLRIPVLVSLRGIALFVNVGDVKLRRVNLVNPTIAPILNNMAALYQAQGHYAEAEPLYQRALGIVRFSLPKNNWSWPWGTLFQLAGWGFYFNLAVVVLNTWHFFTQKIPILSG